MSSLSAYYNGNNIYIYSVKSFRNDKNKPDNKKTIIGKIDPKTYKPTFNKDFMCQLRSGSSDISIEQYNKFINQDFKKKFINKGSISTINNANKNNLVEQNYDDVDENITITTTKSALFDNIKENGLVYFLTELTKQLGLYGILKGIFGQKLLDKILTLSFYLIVSTRSLSHCWKWVDSSESLTDSSMKSQRLSELFDSFTFSERTDFYKKWHSLVKDKEYMAIDTTTISSYSCQISEVEFGHSKENNKIPQINLCLLFGETTGLPIYQTIYNGSLADVSTLLSTIDEMVSITGGNQFISVLDRGFFSEQNVKNLFDKKSGEGFLIGIPFTNSFIIDYIEKYRSIINRPHNALISGKNTIYGVVIEHLYGEKKHKSFINLFYNPIKDFSEREELISSLLKLKNKILAKQKLSKNEKSDVLYYLDITSNINGDLTISLKDEIIDIELSTAGWHAFLSNHYIDPQDANDKYRLKDVVEKGYNRFKSVLSVKRIRVHSSDRMENKLFISFISLIILSKIYNVVKDSSLSLQYTILDILDLLSTVKVLNIGSNHIQRPLTKQIKDIFRAFGIPFPK
jgi:transposase